MNTTRNYRKILKPAALTAWILLSVFVWSVVIWRLFIAGTDLKTELSFNGNEYTMAGVLGFDNGWGLTGYSKLDVSLVARANELSKIGVFKTKDIYEIIGLPSDEWLYVDSDGEMMRPYWIRNGLYKSNAVKLDEISDFAPSKVVILDHNDMHIPDIQIFETTDSEQIQYFVELSTERSAAENINPFDDGNHRTYSVVFTTDKFPHLAYTLDFFQLGDEFYIYSTDVTDSSVTSKTTCYTAENPLIFIK
jgi:hypothetical protein